MFNGGFIKALTLKSENLSAKNLERYKPKMYKTGKKSWVRVKPLPKGVNLNIHLEQGDDVDRVIEELRKVAGRLTF